MIMTTEEMQLLLQDLSAKLPYGVICEDMEGKTRPLFGITPTQHFIVTLDNATDGTNGLKFCTIDCVKPYLRPMSSMTEEEAMEIAILHDIKDILSVKVTSDYIDVIVDDGVCSTEKRTIWYDEIVSSIKCFDWLNAHHFDYRGLIERDLAIAVTEENNPYKD